MTVAINGIVALSKAAYRVTWSGVGAAGATDDGAAVVIPGGYASVTVQVLGTFGGATLSLEGSNDGGSTWAVLNDTRGEGNAMTFAVADLRRLEEVPQMIRPTVVSGSGTSLSVIAIVRKV